MLITHVVSATSINFQDFNFSSGFPKKLPLKTSCLSLDLASADTKIRLKWLCNYHYWPTEIRNQFIIWQCWLCCFNDNQVRKIHLICTMMTFKDRREYQLLPGKDWYVVFHWKQKGKNKNYIFKWSRKAIESYRQCVLLWLPLPFAFS